MEEFIYILIGVIWLGASIYKASQKKKQKARPQSQASSVPEEETAVSRTKSLLEQLLEGQQVQVPEPELVEYEYDEPMLTEIEDKPLSGSFQSEYAGHSKGLEALESEGMSSLGRISFVDIMKETTEKQHKAARIDLRKAIIYSAILERPYI
ncbi:MAG: hypothetical protein IMY74_10545 [Bacteroidetes bacterium]|nr:hypothetical protein [Bacteroidota bacterium]MCK5765497.1 hypothetical protein [Bacteroidales bacterium]